MTFSPYGRIAASTRVRVYDWLQHLGVRHRSWDYLELESHRVANLIRRPISIAKKEAELRLLSLHHFPRVLISRGASPLGVGAIESALLKRSGYGVFDFDDAIMLKDSIGWPGRMFNPERRMIRQLSAADHVIAGNSWLASWAATYNKNVSIIPSCVDPRKFECKTEYLIQEEPKLVWVGSQSTEKYLHAILPALEEVNRHSGATLTIVGSMCASILDQRPFIQRVPWSAESEHSLADYDIALSPLNDGVWELGKCAYKTLQFGASGLPIIGSPVGANAEVLRAFSAPIPRTNKEWIAGILDLIEAQPRDRALLGAKARKVTVSSYSFSAWERDWHRAVFASDLP